jgi:hypothetical protein
MRVSRTDTNIDTLSETSYYIHFDVHPEGACLSEEILEKCPLFDMLLISFLITESIKKGETK